MQILDASLIRYVDTWCLSDPSVVHCQIHEDSWVRVLDALFSIFICVEVKVPEYSYESILSSLRIFEDAEDDVARLTQIVLVEDGENDVPRLTQVGVGVAVVFLYFQLGFPFCQILLLKWPKWLHLPLLAHGSIHKYILPILLLGFRKFLEESAFQGRCHIRLVCDRKTQIESVLASAFMQMQGITHDWEHSWKIRLIFETEFALPIVLLNVHCESCKMCLFSVICRFVWFVWFVCSMTWIFLLNLLYIWMRSWVWKGSTRFSHPNINACVCCRARHYLHCWWQWTF